MSLLREGLSGETEGAEVTPAEASGAEREGAASRLTEKQTALAAVEALAIRRAGSRVFTPRSERAAMPDIDPAVMRDLDIAASSKVRRRPVLRPAVEVIDVVEEVVVETSVTTQEQTLQEEPAAPVTSAPPAVRTPLPHIAPQAA